MRADNLIVFGRTVPEESKKYGQSVCMAGYYPELRQMVRVYPLDIYSKIPSRHYITAELERNNKDSRIESWAVKDRKIENIIVGEKCQEDELRSILRKNIVPNVDVLNQSRLSLGILNPDDFRIELKTRANVKDPRQLSLFDDFKEAGGFKTASNFFYAPYVIIQSESVQKCFQIREWGVYELMRKYEQNGRLLTAKDISNALQIKDGSEIYFVVGNINGARNIWIVIKVFCFTKKMEQMNLLPARPEA